MDQSNVQGTGLSVNRINYTQVCSTGDPQAPPSSDTTVTYSDVRHDDSLQSSK